MRRPLLTLSLLLVLGSCSSARKISALRENSISPVISLADSPAPVDMKVDVARRDTLSVRDRDGRQMIIMKAVKDEDGEMVATEQIDAARVTATFKNVAERHGKVDLRFNVAVPASMTDSRWQLRISPHLYMLGEDHPLDSIQITGAQYRKAQLRGYQQYERYLNSIIRDTALFIRRHELEVFISRNLPELWSFRTDSSLVSDEMFASRFGVTQREAVNHYTGHFRKTLNRRRMSLAPRKFRQYVKMPFVTEGLRLDTVLFSEGGAVNYEYVQTINTQPRLRKAQIALGGSIYEEDRKIFRIPLSDTLSFYISSLSALVDNSEHYVTRVVERRAEANSVCWVSFSQGSAAVDPELGENPTEMGRIRDNLRGLLDNRTFELDSILVTASCSPEGSVQHNALLSRMRSESVCRYFEDFARHCRDSILREDGVMMTLGGEPEEPEGNLKFIPGSVCENWDMFSRLVEGDDALSESDHASIEEVMSEPDLDRREQLLGSLPCYRHLRESLYPRLRTVKFDFYLHRRGMVKDTVHTTELDSTYMRGVQAIRDRDYETAVTLLRPYNDYNTAVACCCMDYNASAKEILLSLPLTAPVKYMLALIYSREGNDRDAIQSYIDACALEPSYIHRGNLDPEISTLVRRYALNLEND